MNIPHVFRMQTSANDAFENTFHIMIVYIQLHCVLSFHACDVTYINTMQ